MFLTTIIIIYVTVGMSILTTKCALSLHLTISNLHYYQHLVWYKSR